MGNGAAVQVSGAVRSASFVSCDFMGNLAVDGGAGEGAAPQMHVLASLALLGVAGQRGVGMGCCGGGNESGACWRGRCIGQPLSLPPLSSTSPRPRRPPPARSQRARFQQHPLHQLRLWSEPGRQSGRSGWVEPAGRPAAGTGGGGGGHRQGLGCRTLVSGTTGA
jgi:hypothetical protein